MVVDGALVVVVVGFVVAVVDGVGEDVGVDEPVVAGGIDGGRANWA